MTIHDTLHRLAPSIPAPAPSTLCDKRGCLLQSLKEILSGPRQFSTPEGDPAYSGQSLVNARDLLAKIEILDESERTAWDATKTGLREALDEATSA